jgi:uncharacterized protein YgiM (DUF1202 family)
MRNLVRSLHPGWLVLPPLLAACAPHAPPQAAPEPTVVHDTVRVVDTVRVTAQDPEVQRRVSALELRLLERDAQLEELQQRLDEATREVVRSMAKLQTIATRAEAASGMAEAELALQALQARASMGGSREYARGTQLMGMSTAEFNNQNYGGALYLATQVKNLARIGGALSAEEPGGLRPGEAAFAVPLPLQVSSRANVRGGPGTNFPVIYTLEKGALITGSSYVNDWLRIADADGRSGWIFRNLTDRRQTEGK